jgi:hypothetical protein
MKVLTGYGETTISGHLHPSGIQVLDTLREASVCVRNRISTVPDTELSFLREALLCDLCASVVESHCSSSQTSLFPLPSPQRRTVVPAQRSVFIRSFCR